jgi:hypothetical protein
MITVEDAESVAAFKDYVHKADAAVAALPVASESSPSPPNVAATQVSLSPSPPPPTIVVSKAEDPVAVVAALPAAVQSTPSVTPTPVSTSTTPPPIFSTYWGLSLTKTSPLAKLLASEQTKFVKLYGTTGQNPIM